MRLRNLVCATREQFAPPVSIKFLLNFCYTSRVTSHISITAHITSLTTSHITSPITFPIHTKMDFDTLMDLINDDTEEEYLQLLQQHQLLVNAEIGSAPATHGGSQPGRSPNVNREHQAGHDRIIKDYFSEQPVYGAAIFRRRFRMQKSLFLKIVATVEAHDSYFVQKADATGKLGLSALQKAMAAIRQLAYGAPADAIDEYIRIGESTAIRCLKQFCAAVNESFGEEYLRYPTKADIERLLAEGEARGFPGMLGSLDCMHWTWKNCPSAWAGQYTGKEKKPTIVLEAVASYDLWIWHAFFGMPGSHNDINVLDRSHLFADLSNGRAPAAKFTINGREYNMGYYLADGIYPSWSTLVQTISHPQSEKSKVSKLTGSF